MRKILLHVKFLLNLIAKTIGYILIFLIRGLRPLLGPAHCKYPISCTDYAEDTLKKESLLKAIWLITKRVLSCNPFMNPKE